MFGFAASVIQTGTLGKLWVPFTDEEKEESFDWKNYSSDKNWKSQDSIQIQRMFSTTSLFCLPNKGTAVKQV